MPGCPGTQLALARVQEAAEALGVDANLRVLIVDSEERAREHGFVGSPTIRVEGRDVEDSSEPRAIGLACRLYGADRERAPSASQIRSALAAAAGRSSEP